MVGYARQSSWGRPLRHAHGSPTEYLAAYPRGAAESVSRHFPLFFARPPDKENSFD